ncbi:hypothetical protein [Chamaesiphon sp. VAR_48_metabat_403]|uniref:hypothetical protein n=1 Tax=Chamaesiphon sp. VAR_48_metabat_403 TaxID=2964700 RepID=UPI00286E19C9|nr:hypothetical protein [Chamaesiphon sp. VAR_48_metabat_403]
MKSMNYRLGFSVNTEFSHGDYADYNGIIFCARSTDGNWIDELHISDIYLGPICNSIMDLYAGDNEQIVKILFNYHEIDENAIEYEMTWGSPITNNIQIGIDLDEDVPSTVKDIKFFLSELSILTFKDLYLHAYGDTETEKSNSTHEFQRCIKVINDYLSERIAGGLEIWVQDD